MCLLDLVEQHHGVGLAADLLCQLARLVIAHVARRASHDAGHGVLLHELGHIQADQALRRVEQVVCQLLDQFRLAHTGGAHEDKAHRLVLGRDAHPVAADGGGHGGDGLVLAHHMGAEALLQLGQALELLLLYLAGGDLRPHLDDSSDVLHGQLRRALGTKSIQLVSDTQLLAAQLRDAGVAVVQLLLGELLALRRLGGHQRLPLKGDILQVALQLHAAVDVRVVEIQVGAGLVDKVDSLVRQVAVGDISFR